MLDLPLAAALLDAIPRNSNFQLVLVGTALFFSMLAQAAPDGSRKYMCVYWPRAHPVRLQFPHGRILGELASIGTDSANMCMTR